MDDEALIASGNAAADDLVAAVLPLSRSGQSGHTVTASATVINSSSQALNQNTIDALFDGTATLDTSLLHAANVTIFAAN